MKSSKAFVYVLASFVLGFSQTANSAVLNGTTSENYVSLYGPVRTFAPVSGTKTQTNTFSVSPAPSQGQLILVNGSGEDLSAKSCSGLGLVARLICVASNVVNKARLELERPSFVEVTVNGVVVVRPGDLPKTVNSLNVPVNLVASSKVVLKIKGSVFSSVSIQIRGLDHTPPVLQLAQPMPNQTILSFNVQVAGSADKPLAQVKAKLGTGSEVPLELSSNGSWLHARSRRALGC